MALFLSSPDPALFSKAALRRARRIGEALPVVTSDVINFNDPSPRPVFAGFDLIAGHAYRIMCEETIQNDAGFAINFQATGDPNSIVAIYFDTPSSPVSTIFRNFGSIVVNGITSDFLIGINPYFVLRDGISPIPTLEAVLFPAGGGTQGQQNIFLLDHGTLLTPDVP